MTEIVVMSDIHFGQMSSTSFFTAPEEKLKMTMLEMNHWKMD